MDSDVDMFVSQETVDNPIVLRSQSRYDKGWVILFNWSHKVEKPFEAYLTKQFAVSEIRNNWIEKVLTSKWRKRRLLPISSLPGQDLSLFAKVEEGIILIIISF